ncbi:MAG: tRNA (N6-isopentenyl adenosine(37)-C2)-methylthiotransferase MiaB [Thermodesulfovibrionia bacterium]|nr:tRNA (N6-isopentenyl adenosine(37)-C2)-methylthiotransferase MiaB [Thermodesulfovibrionia bacterium]
MKKKFFIKTMGCQMNVNDSEKIAGIFLESGYVESDDDRQADVIVFNTCSIRQRAEQKFFSELGRLKDAKKHNAKLRIAVAGCIARQEGEKIIKRFPYVDYVFGPDNIDRLQSWINTGEGRVSVEDNPEYHLKVLPMKREGGVRAWVSIMYGCDNFCAYCVVPYTRGRERSRPAEDIINEIKALSDDGCKEVTLLGQNVNSYGKSLSARSEFPELLENIHLISGIKRIRFVTSHPKDLSDRLINVMRDMPKICEHLHLPLQAGSDNILKLMNRGYTFDNYTQKIESIRSAVPDMAITTDIIAGFPGETDEDFKMTMKALETIGFDGIYAFKYSKRPGTKAVELPSHIDENVKSERLLLIQELQETIISEKNKRFKGETVEILTEGLSKGDADMLTGRTAKNKIVNYCGDKGDIGNLVRIKILEIKQHSLFGDKI